MHIGFGGETLEKEKTWKT